jgi:hypothetical protein
MGDILASRPAQGPGGASVPRRSWVLFSSLALLGLWAVSCHRIPLADTAPLDKAGMTYDTIQQLKALDVSPPEVAELARVRQSGVSDSGCVEMVRIFRNRNHPFDAGDAVAGLAQVGMSEDHILELAKMNQIGLGTGELQAMRLAGLSDETVLEVARHHAAGKPVLSGASLAGLKNVGLREFTLFELVRRGVPDSQAAAMIAYRRHGASDAQILKRFGGS